MPTAQEALRFTVAAIMLAFAAAAPAQSYPAKPIRAVLALGGGGETLFRLLGQRMSESLGQPILVEAQPAAAGSIAAGTVARSAPDGYTILIAATNSQVYRPFLAKQVPYEPVKDFTPIAMIVEAVLVVAASNQSGLTSMKELVERARQAPGKLFYGTSGVGTSHHLSAELLQTVANIRMTHVPYKDPNQVANELIADRMPTGWGIFGTMYPHHTASRLRIIAINNSKRYGRSPEIPTVGEGVPGYEPPPGWTAMFGPAGLPRPIVQRLNTEVTRAVVAPDLREKIDTLGFIPTPSSPDELASELKRSLERTAKIVKAAGIEPE